VFLGRIVSDEPVVRMAARAAYPATTQREVFDEVAMSFQSSMTAVDPAAAIDN
jgi:hypothetical protein